MPTPEKLKAIFYPGAYYHIVCKSIDGLLLFHDNIDYQVFIERFKKFTGDLIDVWSYCLVPNHTHQVVKIKSIETIVQFIAGMVPENTTDAMNAFFADTANEALFNKMIERQMNSFLASYANFINNKYNRVGGIFQKPFKRIQIEEESHLQRAIIYTNANAQKHNLTDDFKLYPFTSYLQILKNDQYFVDAKSVLTFFNGVEKFKLIHEEQVAYYYQRDWPNSKLE
jgi:hypothetical protein